jgi:hypothetical protein
LLGSARPANALYQHKNAHRIAKNPPALQRDSFGIPSASLWMNATPRRSKAISANMNREQKARVDLNVHNVMMTVKINHA